MSESLVSLSFEVNKLREEYKSLYESFPVKQLADGSTARDIPANDVERLQAINKDLDEKSARFEEARKLSVAADANDAAIAESRRAVNVDKGSANYTQKAQPERLSWFESVEKGLSERGDNRVSKAALLNKPIEFDGIKTLMSTSAGFAPNVIRTGEVVPLYSRPPQILDFLQFVPTDQNSVKFMEGTTRTSGAAGKTEGLTLVESALVYTERTMSIYRIGTFLNVTEEQMDDVPETQYIVSGELPYMVRQELDRQVTVGAGTTEILGIQNGASIQTQAKGSDPAIDALLKGIVKVNHTAYAYANVMGLHPTDWQNLCLTRTTDGVYILGAPTDSGVMRVWGMPIAVSGALTAGTALTFDSNYFVVRMRKEIQVDMFEQHGENAAYNILMLRCYCRAGLQIKRSSAACKVTGL